jgi:hypothetical protein
MRFIKAIHMPEVGGGHLKNIAYKYNGLRFINKIQFSPLRKMFPTRTNNDYIIYNSTFGFHNQIVL